MHSSPPPTESDIAELIRAAADVHHVPRQVALSFAWLESRFNPRCEGDLGWHARKQGALYQKHVWDAQRLKCNPARAIAPLWHSYGLFQLMACYFVEPLEHPRVLLNPKVNADRGCKYIASLLERARGDVRAARLAYVGCGFGGELCRESVVDEVTEKLHRAMTRFEGERP